MNRAVIGFDFFRPVPCLSQLVAQVPASVTKDVTRQAADIVQVYNVYN